MSLNWNNVIFSMKTLRIALLGLTLAFLAGCNTQDRQYVAFNKLKSGMSETELKNILGAPTEVSSDTDFVIWTYEAGKVFFRDGKVYSWSLAEPKPL